MMRVLMSMAVWTAVWRQPGILVPWRGLEGPYFCRKNLVLHQGELRPAPIGQEDVGDLVGDLGHGEERDVVLGQGRVWGRAPSANWRAATPLMVVYQQWEGGGTILGNAGLGGA